MKKATIAKIFVFFCAVLMVAQSASGQSTELITREKGKNITSVTISLCNKDGVKSIAPEAFRMADKIYFLVEPAQGYSKPQFRESEVKEVLSNIVLWQSDPAKVLKPAATPQFSDKRITAVLFEFTKNETRAYLPFKFKYEVSSSGEIRLNETYYDFYPQFKSTLDETNRLLSASNWLEAYNTAANFILRDEVKRQAPYISFAKKITDELPLLALSSGSSAIKSRVEQQYNKVINEPRNTSLEALQKEAEALRTFLRLTEAYKNMGYASSALYAQQSSDVQKQLDDWLRGAEESYFSAMFGMLKGQNYLDQRFASYVDIIYQSLLRNFSEDNTQPAKKLLAWLSAGKRNELKDIGWLDDIEELAFAMVKRKQIQPDSAWIPADVIAHLCTLNNNQPKPYCEFLSLAGLSNQAHDDKVQKLQKAINSCSIETELALLELWMRKAILEKENGTALPHELLMEGIRNMEVGNHQRAAERIDMALRQQPDEASIWYQRALVHYLANEQFAAEAKVIKALELNPGSVASVLLYIKLLSEDNQLDQLAQIFSRPVANGPNFLFSLEHARWLIGQKKYSDAIKVLTNECLTLSQRQTEPYYLLGDAYAALGQHEQAREAYFQTQKINPFETDRFEKKMHALGRK